MTGARPRSALVVGAGIGGLSAAVALARAGIEPRLFERSRELAPLGAGLSLWPNAVHVLRELGAAADLEGASAIKGAGAVRSWRGAPLTHTDATAVERRFGAPTLFVHRAELVRALLDALAPIQPELGARLEAVEQDAAGVGARFEDGREARADVLVGADGVDSTVRRLVLADGAPRYAGYVAWRAIARFEPARVIAGESWGPGSVFGIVPLSGGRLYWFGTRPAPAGEQDLPMERKRDVLERFAGWHEPIEDVVKATDAESVLRHDVIDRSPRRGWSQGRVTLLGDAAHPMTPHLGQGACQALEDAAVLAACLRSCADAAAALREYEARRFDRTAAIVRRSLLIGRISQLHNPAARALRDALLRRVPARVQLDQLADVVGFRV